MALTGSDEMKIKVFCDKLNHLYKNFKNKGEERRLKEKAQAAYGKQFKDRCHRCGKIGHKSTDSKFQENKNEKKKQGF